MAIVAADYLISRKAGTAVEIDYDGIILFPVYDVLKQQVEKLRTELSMLVLERDELIYVQCKNLETSYMLSFGDAEYSVYKAQCAMLRLGKRRRTAGILRFFGDTVKAGSFYRKN